MQVTTAKFGAVVQPSQSKPLAKGIDYVVPSKPTELKYWCGRSVPSPLNGGCCVVCCVL